MPITQFETTSIYLSSLQSELIIYFMSINLLLLVFFTAICYHYSLLFSNDLLLQFDDYQLPTWLFMVSTGRKAR